jgi:hypothetical protein
VHVDPGRDAFGEGALEQVRDAAGEFDDLQPAGHLAGGVLQHLAVLGRDDGGQLVLARGQQLAEPEQDAHPSGQRAAGPRPGRAGGRRDHVARVGLVGEADGRRHLARGRIGHLAATLGRAREPRVVHPVLDECVSHAPILILLWR